MRTWTLTALFVVAVAASAVRAAPEPTTTDDKLNQILERMSLQSLQIRALQDEIDRLKIDLEHVTADVRRATPVVTPNVAASINPAASAVPLVPGRIILENRYSFPATVVVNGQSYRLEPLERVVVPATAGAFNYAVYTDNYGLVQGTTNRYLAPGRDFPITINP